MPLTPEPGLCASCRHGRRVEARRGTVFLRCGRAERQPEFPRYPQVPVLHCTGFETDAESPEPETG